MLRATYILFTLLAYLAGTGHCALATAICLATDNATCHTPQPATHPSPDATLADSHSDKNTNHAPHHDHIPHGDDCAIDTLLTAQTPSADSSRLLSPPALFNIFTFFSLNYLHLRPPTATAPPPNSPASTRKIRERLLLLAHSWQFQDRTALPARAPSPTH